MRSVTAKPALRLAASSVVVLLGTVGLLLVGANPAAADVPVGWPDPPAVDTLRTLLFLGGVPILVALLAIALSYGPALARGERVAPGASPVADQWIGGPSKPAGELGASAADETGGASGRW